MKAAIVSALVTGTVLVLLFRFVPPVRNFALGLPVAGK